MSGALKRKISMVFYNFSKQNISFTVHYFERRLATHGIKIDKAWHIQDTTVIF